MIGAVGPLAAPAPTSVGSRYGDQGLLGRGGMGEVHLVRDAVVGRNVARKQLIAGRVDDEDVQSRFLREACIQGRLEHPSIVPVYDIGREPDGRVYFTMKRISGETLAEILAALRVCDREAVEHYSRHRLLTAFSQVCLAVEYAHARGVVHRDLKPENIMIGEFGEVYVLDWGVARVLTDAPQGLAVEGLSMPADVETRAANATREGATLGTPGYMAPEQIGSSAVGPAADVYALGCILFEILVGEPLHRGESAFDRFTSTLLGAEARPSVRAPTLPPMFDPICQRATELEPAERFASARELHEELERRLDHDRSMALRRELAGGHAAAAAAALAEEGDEETARRRALRELGQALALDPSAPGAMATLHRLLVEPPRRIPDEARQELRLAADAAARAGARVGYLGYLAWFTLIPLTLWMGLRDPSSLIVVLACMALAGGCMRLYGAGRLTHEVWPTITLALTCLGIVPVARLFGPYMFLPMMVTFTMMVYTFAAPRLSALRVHVFGGLALLAAILGEWSGLFAQYEFVGGVLTTSPGLAEFAELPTRMALFIATLTVHAFGGVVIHHTRTQLADAQRRSFLLAWQLRQLLPEPAERG